MELVVTISLPRPMAVGMKHGTCKCSAPAAIQQIGTIVAEELQTEHAAEYRDMQTNETGTVSSSAYLWRAFSFAVRYSLSPLFSITCPSSEELRQMRV
jgi:hypothetical protein